MERYKGQTSGVGRGPLWTWDQGLKPARSDPMIQLTLRLTVITPAVPSTVQINPPPTLEAGGFNPLPVVLSSVFLLTAACIRMKTESAVLRNGSTFYLNNALYSRNVILR